MAGELVLAGDVPGIDMPFGAELRDAAGVEGGVLGGSAAEFCPAEVLGIDELVCADASIAVGVTAVGGDTSAVARDADGAVAAVWLLALGSALAASLAAAALSADFWKFSNFLISSSLLPP